MRQYPTASKKAEETLRRLHQLQTMCSPKHLKNIFISNGCLACTSHAAWITPIPSQYEGPMITAVVKVIWGQHRIIRSSGAIFSVLVNPLTCHPKFHHEWQ
eukprot:351232-Karenia_brevis.AAC.1